MEGRGGEERGLEGMGKRSGKDGYPFMDPRCAPLCT